MPTPAEFLTEVNKTYKEALILSKDTTTTIKKKRFSTGIFSLDLITGGGWVFGTNQEIAGPEASGKTYKAIKATQSIATYCRCRKPLKNCDCGKKEPCQTLYVDLEGSLDLDWVQTCGVNLDLMYYVSPQYGEQASDIVNKAIRENVFDLIIIDSYDAMIPLKTVEASIEDGQRMAARAALLGDSLRKWINSRVGLPNGGPALIGINQLREKPGLCLRGDVMIPFVDGTSMCIRDIVKNKISKEIWSYNFDTQKIEPRKIVNWFNHGKVDSVDDWVHIRTTGFGTKNGTKAGTFTKDHKIYIEGQGWTEAQNVKWGDKVKSPFIKNINALAEEFFVATLFGDSHIASNHKTASIIYQDSNDPSYAEWKKDKLTPILGLFKQYSVKWGDNKQGVNHQSLFSHEIYSYKNVHRKPLNIIKKYGISSLMLALWIMDDGYLGENRRYTLSLKRIKDDNLLDEMADILYEKLKLRSRVRYRESSLVFDNESSQVISKLICKHFPKFMEHKLFEIDRNQYEDFTLIKTSFLTETTDMVTFVKRGYNKKLHSQYTNKYDISIERTHNFFAGSSSNGFLVHNSYGDPRYMSGGQAQKYYHDIIIWLKKGKVEDDAILGESARVILGGNAIKNKTFPPGKEFAYNMALIETELYKKGDPDNYEALFAFGKKYELIKKDKNEWDFAGKVRAKNEEEFLRLLKATGHSNLLWRSVLKHVTGYENL